ncbi:hypothetical protein BDR07DRAFT_401713 [Suillus spraguei]|nr:hypothetical protein BDR07DRAFT_401713 [Suillus spraguei]
MLILGHTYLYMLEGLVESSECEVINTGNVPEELFMSKKLFLAFATLNIFCERFSPSHLRMHLGKIVNDLEQQDIQLCVSPCPATVNVVGQAPQKLFTSPRPQQNQS